MAKIIPEQKYYWKIDRWNGGLSEDSRVGNAGSARYMVGYDIRSDSGLLKVARKPTKDSGTSIEKLIKWIEPHPTNGDIYFYGGDTIYLKHITTYSAAHVMTLDSPNGQGLADFDGYLYYRSATQLGRFDYNATWDDDWQTGLETTSTFSVLERFKNFLLVGHGRYVGTVDDVGTWNATRITLPPGYNVRDIFRCGSWAVILAIRGNTVKDSDDGMMFLWNGTSQTYDDWIPLDGNPHAGISNKNKIIVITGQAPVIQESLGAVASMKMAIPKVNDGDTAEVFPGAMDLWRNMPHFGISDGTSTSVIRAVYNWGVKNSRFEDALNSEFPISTGTLLGTGVQITALKKIGTTIFYAWKDATAYGIDKIDTAAFQTSGIYRSLAFDRVSPYEKTGFKVMVELAGALKTNESVTIKISGDPYDDESFTDTANIASITETTTGLKLIELPLTVNAIPIKSRDLHLEITAGGTAATKPVIKRVWTELMESQDTM
jgi:nitrogen fixation-related uncharacterized protein